MAINLEKGQRQSIDAPKFTVGLGWDSNSSNTGSDFDLDASVFLVGANGKIPNDNHFVYYNNLKSPDGAVTHTGDNLTGAGDGDDEKIQIDLSTISPDVHEISFVVTIHHADTKRQKLAANQKTCLSFVFILKHNFTSKIQTFTQIFYCFTHNY